MNKNITLQRLTAAIRDWREMTVVVLAILGVELLVRGVRMEQSGIGYYLIWVCCFYTLAKMLRFMISFATILLSSKAENT